MSSCELNPGLFFVHFTTSKNVHLRFFFLFLSYKYRGDKFTNTLHTRLVKALTLKPEKENSIHIFESV